MLVNKAGKNTTKNIIKTLSNVSLFAREPRHRDTGYDSFGREMMRVPGVEMPGDQYRTETACQLVQVVKKAMAA